MKYPLLLAAAAAVHGASAFSTPTRLHVSPRAASSSDRCAPSGCVYSSIPISDSEIGYDPSNKTPAQIASEKVGNCGPRGTCQSFDAEEQLVSVTGENAFQAPGPTDIRGPCPGLNAAANHGYISRTGVTNINEAVEGLQQLYGLSPELTLLLATYAVALTGDSTTLSWSIGGPLPESVPPGLSAPQGLSYSHDNFEADSSLTRCDAYLWDGDAHSLSPTRFQTAYESGMTLNRYTFDGFARLYAKNQQRSVLDNPYYIAELYSGTVMVPSMYTFAINFFSNHSHTVRKGYLGGGSFQTFMAVKGDYPNFLWKPGKERIPENFYRRPANSQFTVADLFDSLSIQYRAYPKSFAFGGNEEGTNTYHRIDPGSYSGGVYPDSTLFKGNNFACFFYTTQLQTSQTQIANANKETTSSIAASQKLVQRQLHKAFASLDCAPIGNVNEDAFDRYPGARYSPFGSAQPC